ncbi:YajG family lipoprotein [Neptuniibacter halophilus]|uniref:YajG family lipoprotein n=1 Tax=Neptuniibacter halophilus TaxID=651666 RepID=UPI00257330D8|nr:YajG family lipoprotein [Neptuniibacter halophilus]
MPLRPISFKTTCLTLLLAAVAGCAPLNTQVLDLHPEISVSRQLKPTTRVDVQAKDLRTSEVIGLRLTNQLPYPEIRLKDSLQLLKHSTEHALQDMGISRLYAGEFKMTVSLIDLTYQVQKSALKQEVKVNMKLRVELEKENDSYRGDYAAEQSQIFLGTPSEAENEKLIAELAGQTLTLAMNDQQLLDFLQFK